MTSRTISGVIYPGEFTTVTKLVNNAGAPGAGTVLLSPTAFTTNGGTCFFSVDGSAFTGSSGVISMVTAVDGSTRSTRSTPANTGAWESETISDHFVVSGLTAGSHTIGVTITGTGGQVDPNNKITVTLLEIH